MLSQPEGPESAGTSILYFGVADARAARRSLSLDGVPFEEEPRCIVRIEGREVWLAICRDSEDNLLGLISEAPAESA